jgi:hypothetical protein
MGQGPLILLLFCVCCLVSSFGAGSYAYMYMGPAMETKPSSEDILAALGPIPSLKAKTVKLENSQGALVQEIQILNKMSRNLSENVKANTDEPTAHVVTLDDEVEIDKVAVINKPGPAETIVGSQLVFLNASGGVVKKSKAIGTAENVLEYDLLVDKWRKATFQKYNYKEDGTPPNAPELPTEEEEEGEEEGEGEQAPEQTE